MNNDYDEMMQNAAEGYYYNEIEKENKIKIARRNIYEEGQKVRANAEIIIRKEHPDWSDYQVQKRIDEILKQRIEELEFEL